MRHRQQRHRPHSRPVLVRRRRERLLQFPHGRQLHRRAIDHKHPPALQRRRARVDQRLADAAGKPLGSLARQTLASVRKAAGVARERLLLHSLVLGQEARPGIEQVFDRRLQGFVRVHALVNEHPHHDAGGVDGIATHGEYFVRFGGIEPIAEQCECFVKSAVAFRIARLLWQSNHGKNSF